MRWIVAVLLVVLTGCDRSVDSQLAGTWKQVAHGDSIFEQMMVQYLPRVQVEFKPDHSFRVSIPSFKLETVGTTTTLFSRKIVEGTWKVQGRAALFESKTTDGQSVALLRAQMATARSQAQLEQHDRMVQEAIQRQLSSQGQASGPNQYSADNALPNMPSYAKSSDQLVLPAKAELSEDGRKLVLRFEGNDSETVDLEQE